MSDHQRIAGSEAPGAPPAGRLLFVDQDPILREFAIVNLADRWRVETAAGPDVALAILAAQSIDAVILDLGHAAGGGFELLAQLRADPRRRDLPVLTMSARDDLGAIDRAYAEGADGFTVKPLNWRLLSRQMRFLRRAAVRERRAADARAVALDRAERLASTGAKFVAAAIRADSGLRIAALPFARAAGEALKA